MKIFLAYLRNSEESQEISNLNRRHWRCRSNNSADHFPHVSFTTTALVAIYVAYRTWKGCKNVIENMKKNELRNPSETTCSEHQAADGFLIKKFFCWTLFVVFLYCTHVLAVVVMDMKYHEIGFYEILHRSSVQSMFRNWWQNKCHAKQKKVISKLFKKLWWILDVFNLIARTHFCFQPNATIPK